MVYIQYYYTCGIWFLRIENMVLVRDEDTGFYSFPTLFLDLGWVMWWDPQNKKNIKHLFFFVTSLFSVPSSSDPIVKANSASSFPPTAHTHTGTWGGQLFGSCGHWHVWCFCGFNGLFAHARLHETVVMDWWCLVMRLARQLWPAEQMEAAQLCGVEASSLRNLSPCVPPCCQRHVMLVTHPSWWDMRL